MIKAGIFILFAAVLFVFGCSPTPRPEKELDFWKAKDVYVKAIGKKEMILRSERPYNLETPQKYFRLDYTPNNEFFVRWHLANLPQSIDIDTFRLRIHGFVTNPLELSFVDLKSKFHPVTYAALAVCAGNSRSQFSPGVPGVQWTNGAMGNAKWTGITLKELLEAAGIKKGALEVAFNGMDEPPLSVTPDFMKSIPAERAMDGEVMIAYEMNGDTIPLLNGYPLKLIVPGWYATYWIGMLNEIRVSADTFKTFWMQNAYQVPKGITNGNEKPDSLSKQTEPIKRIAIRSVFVCPEADKIVYKGEQVEVQGLAFDGGSGIAKVELSTDSGKTWMLTRMDKVLGKYAWRRWRFDWTPSQTGTQYLMVRATGVTGETQPTAQWNHSGYMKNQIEKMNLFVTEK